MAAYWPFVRSRWLHIDQMWGQDGCILAKFFSLFITHSCTHMMRNEWVIARGAFVDGSCCRVFIDWEIIKANKKKTKTNKPNIHPPWLNKLGLIASCVWYKTNPDFCIKHFPTFHNYFVCILFQAGYLIKCDKNNVIMQHCMADYAEIMWFFYVICSCHYGY